MTILQNAFNNKLVAGLQVGLGSDATGDLYYLGSGNLFSRLGIGSTGQVLQVIGGLPSWQTVATGGSPSGNAGGDLSGTYPNPTVALNAISYAKMQTVANNRVLGNVSGATGNITELTSTQLSTLLGLGTAALLNVGTGANNIVQLDAGAKIPANLVPAVNLSHFYGTVANTAARLALTTTNVQPDDMVKQSDTGLTYVLTATDPSVDANWVSIGDTAIDASDVATGTMATARLGSGTANSGTVLFGDQTYKAIPFVPFPDTGVTTTTVALAANNSYRMNNAALVVGTLPSTAAVGSQIRIIGMGAGGWRVAQNAGQNVQFGNLSSTAGVTGQLNSTNQYDGITLVCIVANTTWVVVASIGNIDMV